ncbi:unnamed protein product [Calypogeia fissa]
MAAFELAPARIEKIRRKQRWDLRASLAFLAATHGSFLRYRYGIVAVVKALTTHENDESKAPHWFGNSCLLYTPIES